MTSKLNSIGTEKYYPNLFVSLCGPLRPCALCVKALGLALCLTVAQAYGDDPTFNSAGVKLPYVDSGSGIPVVLVHGYTENWRKGWRDSGVVESLVSAGFRVIAFDQRGHGAADKPHAVNEYGIQMVDDIRRLLDHRKIDRVHLVGYSMGAAVANKFRDRYPNRLLSVTLSGYGEPPIPDEYSPELEEEVRTNLAKMGLAEGNDAKALSCLSVGWSQWRVGPLALAKNRTRTLLLIGADDPFLADTRQLASKLATADLKLIPGDHGTARSQTEFKAELLRFLGAKSSRSN